MRATELEAIFRSVKSAGQAALIEAKALLLEVLEAYERDDYLAALNALPTLNARLMFAESRLKLCLRKTQTQNI